MFQTAILPRTMLGVLVLYASVASVLPAVGPRDYPNLHTILDTGVALLSGTLALLLWDMGVHAQSAFPKRLAISFAVTFLLEFAHVLVTVEWFGPLANYWKTRGNKGL